MKIISNVEEIIHKGKVLQKELEIPLNERTVRMIIIALTYRDGKYIIRVCETHYPPEEDYLDLGFDKNEILQFDTFQNVSDYLEPLGGILGFHAAKGLKYL